MLWNRRSDAFLGIDMNTEQREAAFEKLEAEGLIRKTAVEGIRFPMYFLTEDLPLVDAVGAVGAHIVTASHPRTGTVPVPDPFFTPSHSRSSFQFDLIVRYLRLTSKPNEGIMYPKG